MRFPRPLLATLAFLAFGSLAGPAGAQLAIGTPDWSTTRDNRPTAVINREDCLADASIAFNTTFATPVAGSFQLWAGTGCEDGTKRANNNGCVQVGSGSTTDTKVAVRVQNLIKAFNDTAEGTAATCDTNGGEGLLARTLFFFVIDGSDAVAVQGVQPWAYEFDIIAPPAPTMVTAASGERSLSVEFKGPEGDNLNDYRFYCAPAESDCSAAALVPGMPPNEDTYCGSTAAQGSASASTNPDLQNDALYAVGVSARDTAGNIGVLSEVACGTPLDVTGFYEAYRAAGGKAGGGFCSFAPATRPDSATLACVLLLGGIALWRRRR